LVFKGVELGSKDEEDERLNYDFIEKQKLESLERDKKQNAKGKEKQEKFLNFEKTLTIEINRFKEGELRHWKCIVRLFKYNILNKIEWKELSINKKTNIIDIAKEFLEKNDTKCDCGNNCDFIYIISNAFNLIINEDEAYLKSKDQVIVDIFDKWANWILFSDASFLFKTIVELLYEKSPSKTTSLVKSRFLKLIWENASEEKLKQFFDRVSFIKDDSLYKIYHSLIIKNTQFQHIEDLYLFKKIAEKLLKENHPAILKNLID